MENKEDLIKKCKSRLERFKFMRESIYAAQRHYEYMDSADFQSTKSHIEQDLRIVEEIIKETETNLKVLERIKPKKLDYLGTLSPKTEDRVLIKQINDMVDQLNLLIETKEEL